MKMLAAREALIRSYADIQQRRRGNNFTAKIRDAAIALAWRYESLRDRLRESGRYEPLAVAAKFDRVVFTCDTGAWQGIRRIEGFIAKALRHLWRKDYRFAQRIKGTGSISEVVVEYEPTAAWFPQVRITIIPRDESGLRYRDLRMILAALPGAKLNVLEVAWDFPSGCVVDLDYVRRFGLLGSTWLQPGSSPYHDKWGGTRSKIARAYFKWETFRFRLELELHVRFLGEHGISDTFDFHKLVAALVPDHVDFAQFDEVKLVAALRRTGLPRDERTAILKRVQQISQGSLWRALRYLREKAHLKNVHRLLVPVPKMNRAIREALENLVKQWPGRPKPLRRKP